MCVYVYVNVQFKTTYRSERSTTALKGKRINVAVVNENLRTSAM